MSRKTIPAATGLTAADNEILDVLAARMNVSHAEVLRRGLHLLATAHSLPANPEAARIAARMRATARAEAEAEWEREIELKARGWA